MTSACHECGSENVLVAFDDETLRERGAFEIECLDSRASLYVPAETTARSRIAALRRIAQGGGVRRIDGYIVDAMTAGMLVAVYDALSPANREKFGKPPLEKLVDLGWRHARAA